MNITPNNKTSPFIPSLCGLQKSAPQTEKIKVKSNMTYQTLTVAKATAKIAFGIIAFVSTPALAVVGGAVGILCSKQISKTVDKLSLYTLHTWQVARGKDANYDGVADRIKAWMKISLIAAAIICTIPSMWEFYVFAGFSTLIAKEVHAHFSEHKGKENSTHANDTEKAKSVEREELEQHDIEKGPDTELIDSENSFD